jgi:hypothetical protein
MEVVHILSGNCLLFREGDVLTIDEFCRLTKSSSFQIIDHKTLLFIDSLVEIGEIGFEKVNLYDLLENHLLAHFGGSPSNIDKILKFCNCRPVVHSTVDGMKKIAFSQRGKFFHIKETKWSHIEMLSGGYYYTFDARVVAREIINER